MAVYANFTLLNYYIPLCLILLGVTIYDNYNSNRIKLIKHIFILGLITLFLASLCYLPFSKMMATKQFVYWGATGFFHDTVKPLIISIRSGTEYFGWTHEAVIISVLALTILMIASACILYNFHKNKRHFIVSIFLLILIIGYNHVQFYLMEIPFLNARTALFLIPVVVLNIGFGLQAMINDSKPLGLSLVLIYGFLSFQHFVRGFNVKSTFEWYYDENTYDVLKDMDEIIRNENIQKPVKVNCHWIFYPSLSYHIEQKYPEVFELVPYHKELEVNSNAMFYYTQSDEVESLSPKFGPIRDYGWKSRVLLKSK